MCLGQVSAVIRGVVFDFDLTLVDSARGICENLNALAAEKGLRSLALAEVRKTIGWALTDAMRSFWGNGPVDDEWLPRYRELFEERHYAGVVPFAETIPAVTLLKQRGILVAIASNRLSPANIVQAAGLASFFPVVAGIEGINAKPAPDVIFKALTEMKIRTSEAAYVGDSDIDMATAVNAAVIGIGVTTGNFGREFLVRSGASYTIQSLAELPHLLEVIE
jgi:phosphoglycolate phosphatase